MSTVDRDLGTLIAWRAPCKLSPRDSKSLYNMGSVGSREVLKWIETYGLSGMFPSFEEKALVGMSGLVP